MGRDAKKKDARKSAWEIIWSGVVVIVFVVLILVFGVALLRYVVPVLRWLLIAGTVVVFLIALGMGMSGRPAGILIDSHYKMSLSRLQMTLWTILVFSAYLTIALPRSMPGGLPDIQTPEQVDACIKYLEDQDSEEAKNRAAGIKALRDQDSDEAKEEARRKAQEECTPRAPLNITFPLELVAALGISTASLAGSSLIKSVKDHRKISDILVRGAEDAVTKAETKRDGHRDELTREEKKLADLKKERDEIKRALKSAEEAVLKELKAHLAGREHKIRTQESKTAEVLMKMMDAQEALDTAKKDYEVIGGAASRGSSLHANESPAQASWADMFRYEEAGKEEAIDLAKVQMFFFTIVVVLAYGAAIYGLLTEGAALTNPLGVDFPGFSSSLNALLGLSHAGYLSSKATTQT